MINFIIPSSSLIQSSLPTPLDTEKTKYMGEIHTLMKVQKTSAASGAQSRDRQADSLHSDTKAHLTSG